MKLIEQKNKVEEKCHNILVGNYDAKVFYEHTTDLYQTEGEKKYIVSLFKVLPESVMVQFFAAKREQRYIRVALSEFEKRDPAFRGTIIATFNCHGFTLTNERYFIDVLEATKVFEDEFEECSFGEADAIVFYDSRNMAQHSARYLFYKNRFVDKQGVRPIKYSSTIAEIKECDGYSNLQEKFMKRKVT